MIFPLVYYVNLSICKNVILNLLINYNFKSAAFTGYVESDGYLEPGEPTLMIRTHFMLRLK